MTSTAEWKPTAAHVRAVVGAATFALIAVLGRRPDLIVLATPLAVAATGAVLHRPWRDPVVKQTIDHATLHEGQATTWKISISDPDDLVDDVGYVFPDARWIQTAPGTDTSAVSLRDDGDESCAVRLRPTHWGSHVVRPATVVASSAWHGFQYVTASPNDSSRLLALPSGSRFDATAPAVRTPGLIGANRSPRPGSGSEFAGIRPFAPGDRLRRIHWTESLRSGELHVTSTWSDDDRHVVLLIDAFDDVGQSDGINGRASSLDISVRAAAAIAEHYCTSGDRVTVVTMGATGFRRISPSTGYGHLRRLLEVLARVRPAHVLVDDGRIPRGLGRDALVVLLSPLISQSSLQRLARLADRGLAAAAIDCLPAGIVDEHPGDPYPSLVWRLAVMEREQQLRRVRKSGIAVVPWVGPGSLDLVLRGMQRRISDRTSGR